MSAQHGSRELLQEPLTLASCSELLTWPWPGSHPGPVEDSFILPRQTQVRQEATALPGADWAHRPGGVSALLSLTVSIWGRQDYLGTILALHPQEPLCTAEQLYNLVLKNITPGGRKGTLVHLRKACSHKRAVKTKSDCHALQSHSSAL